MVDIYKHKPKIVLTPEQEKTLLGGFEYIIEGSIYTRVYVLPKRPTYDQIIDLYNIAKDMKLYFNVGSTTSDRYPIYFTRRNK